MLEFSCAKDSHIVHSVTSYQKNILHVRYIHGENNKTSEGNVEHRYVMQGRPIVQEIVTIISKLHCIHKYYST